jgi:hypothetical protein
MMRRPLLFVALGAATSAALAGAAAGQPYPTHFAPRCPAVELQYLSQPDPCEPHYAVFGLTGPTVVTRGSIDVDATGSIEAAKPNQPATRKPPAPP